jgi:hypothetical protein
MIELVTYKPSQKVLRDNIVNYIQTNFESSCDGVSTCISALCDYRDYVIVIYVNGITKGAASYFSSKRTRNVEVDHLGVLDHEKGYGTLLMHEIFKEVVDRDMSTITLITNGSSNEFYEKIGMRRLGTKLPAMYELTKNEIMILFENY